MIAKERENKLRRAQLRTLPVGYSEDHLSLAIQELGEKLIETLTMRGFPVSHSAIQHRVFYNAAVMGGRWIVEVFVEFEQLSNEEREELTHAYRIGQLDGRYYERLLADDIPGLSRSDWLREMQRANESPWNPAFNHTDRNKARVMDIAWRRGWVNGRHAQTGSGELTPSPYMKDEESE